jgi:hypothetical protein
MTFAAPLFLLAGLAAAIPVILHLINRQRAKDLPFPTLRFLRISVQKTRRRKRIHDLFLMLLRMAALLLIALGLAGPTVTNLTALLGAGSSSAVAIVLDNSASMGVIDEGKPRFETALNAARQIMDELKDRDAVALFLSGGPRYEEEGRMDRGQDKVRQMLNQVGVSYERADLAVKVRQARKQLVKSEAKNKQIYVITDLQESCWDGLEKKIEGMAEPEAALSEEEEKEIKIPVIFVDCNRTPKPNVAVQNVKVEAAVPVAGLPIKADVTVLNASPAPQQRHLELYVDGTREAASPSLEISGEGTKEFSFPFTFKRGGLHRGEVKLIGDDGSPLDDRRFFAMEVDQGIPIAVVKAQNHEIAYLEDTFYLQQALAPAHAGGWALKTDVMTAADLASANLGQYLAVYCVNLPAPGSAVAEKLRTYVQNGGNLIWICGENVDPAAYNQMNEQAQGSLLPAPLLEIREPGQGSGRDSWFIGQIDKEHKALAHLAEPASLYQSVLVYKHVRMDATAQAAGGARVLARLDDGQPILVERNVQRGRVIALGTNVHVGWTNLPIRPLFLPLFARMTFEMAGGERTRPTAIAGTPIVQQLDEQNRPTVVEVVSPSGEMERPKMTDEQGNPLKEIRYPNTHDIGVYIVKLLGNPRPSTVAVSVNVDPEEANPKKIEREELEKRFSPTPLVFAEDPDDLTSTFKLLREGESLWETFLGLVLAVLVFETLISNLIGPKKDEQEQPQHVPPGSRRAGKKPRAATAA